MNPQALLLLAGWMNRQQQQVIEFLVEDNRILREQLDIHTKGRCLGRKILMKIATLVTPETIYRWHRQFVAMAYAECFVKSIKRECLNKMVFFSEAALWKVISEYVLYYHHQRPHQGRDNQIIEPDVEIFSNQGLRSEKSHISVGF